MPRSPKISLFCIVLLFTVTTRAQNNLIDSLQKRLATVQDTARVNVLNKLASAYWYVDPVQTIAYANEAIVLAKKTGFMNGLSSAYNNMGAGYYQQNDYRQALVWYNRAVENHRLAKNFRGEGHVLSNIGMIYWKQGVLDTSVQYYLQSLKIWEANGVENEKASVYENIGNVYNEQEDYDRALEYYFRALEIEKKFPNTDQNKSMTMSNIGTAYLGKEKYKDALTWFTESLKWLNDDEKESHGVSLSNIGLTYIELKDYEKAGEYLTRALALQNETGDSDGMVHTLVGLSRVRQQLHDLKASSNYANQALLMAQRIGDKGIMAEIWVLLSEISSELGDHKKAYEYFTKFVDARDSIRNKENIYKIAHLQAGFETQKKQAEIEALKKERAQQSFRRNTIGAGLIGLLVIAVLVVSFQRLKIRKNSQLEKINRQLTDQSKQLEEQTRKLRELDHVKSTFFANISHEFRTPLTLILNSLSDLISTTRPSAGKDEMEQLEVMHRNAKRLLNLINQLLDLSKLDAGQMRLSAENCDLNQLLTLVHGSFSSLGHSRNIHFKMQLPQEKIICKLDIDKVEKILYNLLSNAFKFTPVGGTIEMIAEKAEDIIRISVQDSGRGIDASQLDKVFNRFYQGNQYYSDEQGTGIGLALTKELVELHGGTIKVESNEHGARFVATLPFVTPDPAEPIHISEKGVPEPLVLSVTMPGTELGGAASDAGKPSVLIAEDNIDLRNYIKKHLAAEYDVIEAGNGIDAFNAAAANIPDLVISDWMMPGMDGIELCGKLKTDERTSHIPVIMLTALASNDARLQGLTTGADEYLTKPFDNRELLLRIKNLVESRKALREKFSRELHLGPKKVAVSSMDEKFLEKVMDTVETHMGDPDFSMEKFGQQVGLSRMQLHRKLKALTGESPGDFLRTMRLKKARQLLQSKAGNVSEVAYQVGFNNLSYFSKCYREEYNMAPNETFLANVTQVTGNVTG